MEDADSSGSGLVTGRRSRKVNTTDMHPAPPTDPSKRTYDEMSQEGGGEASASQPHFRQPVSASLNRSFPPPPSPHRYHGDGFDFRRPVMSSTMPLPSGVIDLTDDLDTAPARTATFPRFQRTQRAGSARTQPTGRSAATSQPEVIDLDDDDTAELQRAHTPQSHAERDSSPEVEFVASNTLNSNRGDDFTGSLPRSSAAAPRGSSYFRDGPFSNNIGLQIARIFNDSIRGGYFGRRNIMGVGMGSLTPHIRHRQAASQRQRRQAHGRAPLHDSLQTQLPGELNYHATAFPYPIPEPAPRLPTYQKPSSPREGYTRAPSGEEVVVCPNCDLELGAGDDDLKRQVWVVRACGHVYCGECTTYRTKTSRKGRTDITAPTFSKCVVDGCGKAKTSGPKAMIQVYI